ncbi:hypothetical protein ACE6H2_028651 [Prunus campanulata]
MTRVIGSWNGTIYAGRRKNKEDFEGGSDEELERALSKYERRQKTLKKGALVSVLGSKNPENAVAVTEELVARKKLLKCVSNMDSEELGLLLMFLQKHSTLDWSVEEEIRIQQSLHEIQGIISPLLRITGR